MMIFVENLPGSFAIFLGISSQKTHGSGSNSHENIVGNIFSQPPCLDLFLQIYGGYLPFPDERVFLSLVEISGRNS